MIRITMLFIIFLFGLEVKAQQTFQWTNKAGGINADDGAAVATDSIGNVYVTGSFRDTVSFGDTTLIAEGDWWGDLFIAKYSTAGKLLWARQGGGTESDKGTAITVKGNAVYVAGTFEGIAYFGDSTFISKGITDGFLAKYTLNGDFIWAIQIGGIQQDKIQGVAVDNFDNVVITGSFEKTAYFGSLSLQTAALSDMFLAKYNENGIALWAAQGGGNSRGSTITVGNNNEIYVAGHFEGTCYFNTETLISAGSFDNFLAKYNSNGSEIWIERFGGNQWDFTRSLSLSNNQLYLTGVFRDSTIIGPYNLSGGVGGSIYFCKYDLDGNCLWAKTINGSGDDRGNAIITNDFGKVYLTGTFGRVLYINGDSIVSTNSTIDIFVASLDNSNGNINWIESFGGPKPSHGYGIALTPSEEVVLTGYFIDSIVFGNTELVSSGKLDMFVAQFKDLFVGSVELGLMPTALKVFPNPSMDFLTIQGYVFKEGDPAQIEIYEMNGRIISSRPFSRFNSIDISNLSSGQYIIKITNRKEVYAGTFIKL